MACFERRILRWIAIGGLALLAAFPIHTLHGQRFRGRRDPTAQPPADATPPAADAAPAQAAPPAAAATPGAAVAAPTETAPSAQPAQAPESPAAPTEPASLLQQPAQEAQIAFADNRLSIHAENASLTAILHQVATQSGMHISGLGNDERVFGTFGPGTPRDVLADLLNGTAYNLVLLGDLTNGAPRELILTPVTRSGEAPPSQAFHQAVPEDAAEQQDVSDVNPPAPEVQPPPAAPGNPGVRTPQQLFEQLQQLRQAQQAAQQGAQPGPQQGAQENPPPQRQQ